MKFKISRYGSKYPIVHKGDVVVISKYIPGISQGWYKERLYRVLNIENWKLSQPVIRAKGITTEEEVTFGNGWIEKIIELNISDVMYSL